MESAFVLGGTYCTLLSTVRQNSAHLRGGVQSPELREIRLGLQGVQNKCFSFDLPNSTFVGHPGDLGGTG